MRFFLLLFIIVLRGVSGKAYRLGGCSVGDCDVMEYPNSLKKGSTRDVWCSICGLLELLIISFVFQLHLEWWQYVGYVSVGFLGLRDYGTWINKIYAKICSLGGRQKCLRCHRAIFDRVGFVDCGIAADKNTFNWFYVGLVMSSRWLFIFFHPYTVVYAFAQAFRMAYWRTEITDVTIEEPKAGRIFII